jgi:hypothetical protein
LQLVDLDRFEQANGHRRAFFSGRAGDRGGIAIP